MSIEGDHNCFHEQQFELYNGLLLSIGNLHVKVLFYNLEQFDYNYAQQEACYGDSKIVPFLDWFTAGGNNQQL
jgi:hypothetical protein